MTKASFKSLNSLFSLSAIHQRMVVYALNQDEELVHVDSVNRGKLCKCRCLSCGEALVARQGELKSHSFAHESGTECLYAMETMFLWLAKELISTRGFFVTPELKVYESLSGPLRYIEDQKILGIREVCIESAKIETRTNRTRSDLVLSAKGHELLIEIVVTKKADAKRLESISNCQLSAIEIDLSEVSIATVADFEHILFTDSKYKKWLFNGKEEGIRNILRAKNLEKLSLQESEIEQNRIEKEAVENLKNKQSLEAAEKKKAEEFAHVSNMLAVILEERPRLSIGHTQRKVYRRSKDRDLWFLWGTHDSLYIVAQNCDEQVGDFFQRIGVVYDEANHCYLARQSQYDQILKQLAQLPKNV